MIGELLIWNHHLLNLSQRNSSSRFKKDPIIAPPIDPITRLWPIPNRFFRLPRPIHQTTMISLFPTQNISFYTIPIAWVLTLAPHAYATQLCESKIEKQFDLTQPRGLTAKLAGDQTIDQATKDKRTPFLSYPPLEYTIPVQ